MSSSARIDCWTSATGPEPDNYGVYGATKVDDDMLRRDHPVARATVERQQAADRAVRPPMSSPGHPRAVAEYIDWFNHRRLHGEIDLIPPAEHEDTYYRQNTAPARAEASVPSLH